MEPLATAQVQAYLFDSNSAQYEDKGMAGLAIVGQAGSPGTYRIGCYVGSDYLCTADITNNNDTGIQWSIIGTGYASFRDDNQRIWSISFPGGDPEAFKFSASVSVAMYGASNQPEGSVICCDVNAGKRDRIVVPNDKVKARYCSWVVQRQDGATASSCPKLGSQLESNENDESAYVYAAPINHNSVTSDMKGFEGMTIGMAEESRRFIIVPKAARRGSGPNIHVCYMVYIVKKKDNAAAEVEQWRQMQQGSNTQSNNNNNGNNSMTPRGGNNNNNNNQNGNGNGPITVVVQSQSEKKKKGALVVRDSSDNDRGDRDEDEDGSDVDDRRSSRGRKDSHRRRSDSHQRSNSASSMPAPAPGFNFEQMDVINRMRDQVSNLLLQIKETTSRVDLFSHDMRKTIEKSKPKSLGTAQMKHTLDSMLEETDQLKTTLEERDKTLRQLEDKNKDLQGKVDAFSATASRLSEEKKAALAETSQVKLDGDSKALQLQSELTRIMSEREDSSRHLSSVKRLLEISDSDAKKEKQGLQTAEVQMTTIEAKMSSADEQLQEERSRRKLLESKISTLGDELRSVLEEIRVKESQIDERRRKMEADKLHYTQIMDEERNRAADEMRELRDELVQEITVRDRRYQEERGRVARESFERGRVQGIEDGHNEAAMEVDARMQTLVLETQRYRSEVETIKVRLAQSRETAEASRRHQESHCQALGRVVDELQSQIHASEVEHRSLESTRVTAQASAAEAITDAVKKLTRPISRSDLLGVMHQLRTDRDKMLDTTFESDREKEERERVANDREQIIAWVKRRAVAPVVPGQPAEANEPAPTLRTPWPEDVIPDHLQPVSKPSSPVGADFLNDDKLSFAPVATGPTRPDFVQDVEKRQRELLQALHKNDPSLELIAPPKPPTPEPEPTPEPSEKSDDDDENQEEKHVDPTLEKEGEDDEWDEDEKKRLPQPSSNQTSQRKFDSEDDDEADQQQQQQQKASSNNNSDDDDENRPIPAKKDETSEEEEEDDQGYGYDAQADFSDPAAKKQPAPQKQDDNDEEEEEQEEVTTATKKANAAEDDAEAEEEAYDEEEGYWAAEEEEEDQQEEEQQQQQPQPAATNKSKTTAAPAARQRGLFAASDDDDSDEESTPAFGRKQAPAAVAPKQPAGKTSSAKQPSGKPTSKLFAAAGSDSDEDSDEEESKPVFRVAAPAGKQQGGGGGANKQPIAKPAAATQQKKSLFAETDSDEEDDGPAFVPPAKKSAVAPAPKAVGKKAIPAPKKSLFAASDSDD